MLGLALRVGALIVESGEPTWQVLSVFGLITLTGLGLRIEAAIRRRPGQSTQHAARQPGAGRAAPD